MYVKVIQGEKVLHPPRNYKCKISRKCGQKLPLPLCHYENIPSAAFQWSRNGHSLNLQPNQPNEWEQLPKTIFVVR